MQGECNPEPGAEQVKRKKMLLLEWLDRSSPLLESQIVGSGLDHALNWALLSGYADMDAHPTVRDGGAPAAAVFITGKGKTLILAEKDPQDGQETWSP